MWNLKSDIELKYFEKKQASPSIQGFYLKQYKFNEKCNLFWNEVIYLDFPNLFVYLPQWKFLHNMKRGSWVGLLQNLLI